MRKRTKFPAAPSCDGSRWGLQIVFLIIMTVVLAYPKRVLSQQSTDVTTIGEIVRLDNRINELIRPDAKIELLASGILDALPEPADRILLCDAVVYRCDAFCTRDWQTIIKYRNVISDIPLKVLTPTEWWEEIYPWASTWL